MTVAAGISRKILAFLSAARTLPLAEGKSHRTGYFLGEVMEPLFLLMRGGFDFDLATPDGTPPSLERSPGFSWMR
jgi:putative intracellular protease/amidase